jgi:hypothetical protein
MTFEEWWDKEDANYVEDLARAAWESAYQEGFDDGYDSCQEQRSLLDKEDS